ncbi:MAG TPA: hypothetical protein VII51_05640 [Gaiellaceae bacterium]
MSAALLRYLYPATAGCPSLGMRLLEAWARPVSLRLPKAAR